MTQEQKDLLIKDLCCRMPYGVKADLKKTNCYDDTNKVSEQDIYSFRTGRPLVEDYGQHDYYKVIVTDITPYLFPIESMTEEQKVIYGDLCYKVLYNSKGLINLDVMEYVNWCYKNHIDINNLIPMGLANDATNKNIY